MSSHNHHANWAKEKRYEFIDFRLFWHGKVNRADLEENFGISTQQASLDINTYLKLAPNNLTYDKSKRTYVRGANFKALVQDITASTYLRQILAINEDVVRLDQVWLQQLPAFGATPTPIRTINAEILRDVLEAIEAGNGLRIKYQSMSSAHPSSRIIDPHAIGFDGFRWHARAFCRKDQLFKDFVVARMTKVEPAGPAASMSKEDQDWNSFVTLEISPHPELSAGQSKAIAMDYGMTRGKLKIPVRQALLYYTLKRLGLDTDPAARKPAQQQIVLNNRSEVLKKLSGCSK